MQTPIMALSSNFQGIRKFWEEREDSIHHAIEVLKKEVECKHAYVNKFRTKPIYKNIKKTKAYKKQNMQFDQLYLELNNLIEKYKIDSISYSIYSNFMDISYTKNNKFYTHIWESTLGDEDLEIAVSEMEEPGNDNTEVSGKELSTTSVEQSTAENTAEVIDSPKNVGNKISSGMRSKLNYNTHLASNTRKFNSSYLTNRWINLPVVKLSASNNINHTIKTYDIVQDLYTHLESTNINISKNFALSAPNISMRFVFNTNQFVQGLYMVSYQYMFQFQQEFKRQDMQDIVNLWNNSGQSYLLDLNKGNTVEFDIPYFNFLNFGATIGSDQQLKNVGNAYATVFIKCIVPLKLASSQCETEISLTPSFMFKDINATGMIPNRANSTALLTNRPGVSLEPGTVFSEMDNVEQLFGKLKFNNPAIQMAEKGLKMVGDMLTADKPLTTSVTNDIIIRETTNTASGVGVENALSMRLDPTGTTSPYYPYAQFKGVSQIEELAHREGFYNVVNINICASDRDHKYLFSLPVELLNEDLRADRNTVLMYPWQSRNDFNFREFIPRPVNVAMMFSQLYRGSLTYNFYSVQTNFHSFSLLVAYVPFDTLGTVTFEQAQCLEHVIINFSKEARSFSYTVPYVNQTPWRKCKPYNMTSGTVGDKIGVDGISYGSIVVFQYNRGSVSNVCATNVDLVITVQGSPSMEFAGNRGSLMRYSQNRRNEEAIDFYPKQAFSFSVDTDTRITYQKLQGVITRIGESSKWTLRLYNNVYNEITQVNLLDAPQYESILKMGVHVIGEFLVTTAGQTVSATSVGITMGGTAIPALEVNSTVTLAYRYMPSTTYPFVIVLNRVAPGGSTATTLFTANTAQMNAATDKIFQLSLNGIFVISDSFQSNITQTVETRIVSEGLFDIPAGQNTLENTGRTQAIWSSEKSLDLLDLAKRWKLDNPILLNRIQPETFHEENLYNRTGVVGVQCQYLSDYATQVNISGLFGTSSEEYQLGRAYGISAIDWLNNSHLYYRGGYRRKLIFPKEVVHSGAASRDVTIARGYKNYQITWIPPSDYCFPKAETMMNVDYHDENFAKSIDTQFLHYFGDPFDGSMPSQIVSTNVNNVVSIEMPYYHMYNFTPTNKLISSAPYVETAHVQGLLAIRSLQDNPVLYENPNNNSPTGEQFLPHQVIVNSMHALGDDAQFYGFWGFPTIQTITGNYNILTVDTISKVNPIITVNPTSVVENHATNDLGVDFTADDIVIELTPEAVSEMDVNEGKQDYVSLVNHWCQQHNIAFPDAAFYPTQELQWKCNVTLFYHSAIYATAQGNTKKVAKNNAFKVLYNKLIQCKSEMNNNISVSNRSINFIQSVKSEMQFFKDIASGGSSIWNFASSKTDKVIDYVGSSKTLTAAASIVSPAAAIGVSAAKANKTLDKVNSKLDDASNNLSQIVQIATEIKDSILSKVNWVKDKGLAIFNGIIAILNMCYSKTFSSVAINLTSLLVNMGLVAYDSYSNCLEFFNQYLRFSSSEQQSEETPASSEMDMTNDTILGLGGALLSMILVSVGCAGSLVKNIPILKIIHWFTKHLTVRNVKDIFMCFNSVGTFLRGIQDLFFEGVKLVKMYIPACNIDEAFIENMPDVKNWMKDIDILCDARSSEAVNDISMYKERLWMAVSRSHYYRQLLGTGAASEQFKKLSHHILKYSDRICKLAENKKSAISCSPVRYEPFVINVYGASNIGKSFISENVIISLLQHINVEYVGHPIYTRTPGVAYWNMFTNQPAVMMDDFLAVKGETFAQTQIAELFNLKSTATFNPNMAAIENKEIRANPLIVYLSSNAAFPPLEGVMHPEAVYRRRDVLIEARIKEGLLATHKVSEVKDLPKDILQRFDHLEFAMCKNVKNPNAENKTEFMSYITLMQTLKNIHRKYHEKEVLNVNTRMDKLNVLLPEAMKMYMGAVDSPLVIRTRLDFVATLAGIGKESIPFMEEDIGLATNSLFLKLKSLGKYSKEYQEQQIRTLEDQLDIDMNSVRKDLKLEIRQFDLERIKYTGQSIGEDKGNRLLSSEVRRINKDIKQDTESQPSTSTTVPIQSSPLVTVSKNVSQQKIKGKKKKQTAASEMPYHEIIPFNGNVLENVIQNVSKSIVEYSNPDIKGSCCHICQEGINDDGEHVGGLQPYYICLASGTCGNHIVCINCAPHYERLNHNTCPDCRSVMLRYDRIEHRSKWSYLNPLFYIGRSLKHIDNFLVRRLGFSEGIICKLVDYNQDIAQYGSIAMSWIISTMVYISMLKTMTQMVDRFTTAAMHTVNHQSGSLLSVGEVTSIINNDAHPLNDLVSEAIQNVMNDDSFLNAADRINAARQAASLIVFGASAEMEGEPGCKTGCVNDNCKYKSFIYEDTMAERLASIIATKDKIEKISFVNNIKPCTFIDLTSVSTVGIECIHKHIITQTRECMEEIDEDYVNLNDDQLIKLWCDIDLPNNAEFEYKIVKTTDQQNENTIFYWKGLIPGSVESMVDCKCNDDCILYKYINYFLLAYLRKYLNNFVCNSRKVIFPRTIKLHKLYNNSGQVNSAYDKMYSILQQTINKPWWQRCGSKILEYWETIKIIGLIGTAFIGLYASYKMFTGFFNQQTINSELIASGSSRTMKAPRSIVRMTKGRVAAQSGNSSQDAILKHILNNTVYIQTSDGKNFRGLGIIGRYFILNQHFYNYLNRRPNVTIKITNFKALRNDQIQSWVDYKLDVEEIWDDQDIVICKIPAQIPMFKNIIPYILPEKEHENISREAQLLEYNLEMCVVNNIIVDGVVERLNVSGQYDSTGKLAHDPYVVSQCYVYNIHGAGKCGSVGILNNTQTPLFSMHTAGKADIRKGYGIPLVQEWFREYEDKVIVKDRVYGEISSKPPNLKLNDSHYYVTSISENIPFVPNKSSIIKSKINGLLEDFNGEIYKSTSEPAMLSNKDDRYPKDIKGTPLSLGVEKTGKENVFEVELNIHNQIINYMKEEMIAKVKPTIINPHKLSINQSILGIPGKPYYDKLDFNTSAGYPYSIKKSKKTAWIEVNEDECVLDPYLLEVIKEKSKQRQDGIVPLTVFMDCLKDERLPIEKAQIPGKTRIFSLSPLDFTVQVRQYFLSFVAGFQDSRFNYNHSVGVAPDGEEWGILTRKLQSYNKHNLITGDYSGFGHTLLAQATVDIVECINEWYKYYNKQTPINDCRTRSVMAIELANALHVANDCIFECGGGCPSGSPLTVVLNSLVNMYYINWAWLRIMKNTKYAGLSNLDKYMYYSVYGDDLIMAVKPEIEDLFNNVTLSNIFKELNIEFTDATKKGNVKYCSYDMATFLKRGFLRHPTRKGEYLAPLSEDSVKDCAMYIFKSASEVEATKINVDQSLRLAYGHGPAFFNKWRDCLNKALETIGMQRLCLSWEECDINFFEGGQILFQFDYKNNFKNLNNDININRQYFMINSINNKVLTCIDVNNNININLEDLDLDYLTEMSGSKYTI